MNKVLLFIMDFIALAITFALWGLAGEATVPGIVLILLTAIVVLLSFDVLVPE